jgi:hypothetical protein
MLSAMNLAQNGIMRASAMRCARTSQPFGEFGRNHVGLVAYGANRLPGAVGSDNAGTASVAVNGRAHMTARTKPHRPI